MKEAKRTPRGAPPRASGPVSLVLVVLAAVAVHAATLGAGFVWDDHALIEANPQIAPPLDLARLFGTHAFGGARGGLAGERVIEYYRPVWTLSLALDRRVWGLRPFGYHLTNVLLHAAASVAVLLLLRARSPSPLAALIGALLFAVHPAHVEAVAWVSARNELLAGGFAALAALAFDAHQRRGGPGTALACLGATALALLSKESAVTLPGFAALLTFTRGGRRGPALRLALALAVVTGGYLLLRARVVAPFAESHAFGERLLAAPALMARNLQLAVLPLGLSVFHDLEVAKIATGLVPVAALVALAGWAACVRGFLRRDRLLALGLMWIPVALLPVSGLAGFTRPALVAERYLYLPSVGVAFLATALAGRALGPGAGPGRRERWSPRAVFGAVAALVVVVGFGAVTLSRVPIWRDDLSLTARMVLAAPRAASAHMNRGAALERAGRIGEALGEYGTAARLAPGDPQTRTNFAVALGKSGRDAEARAEFRAALALRPGDASARAGLGWLAARANDWEASEREYRAAIPLDPGHAAAHAGLALALQNLGRTAEAESGYAAALLLDPAFFEARRNLGVLLRRSGRPAEAVRILAEAVARHPGSPDAHLELSVALSEIGRHEEAERELRAALVLRPRWVEARFNLGAVLAMRGRYDSARIELEAARRLSEPTSPLIGRIDEALGTLPPGR